MSNVHWEEFITELEALNFNPDDWLPVFKILAEQQIEARLISNPKLAAKALSPLMVLQLTKLATTAKSEQVRHQAAKELAHIGGAQPTKNIEDGLSHLTEEEIDAEIRGYLEEEDIKRKPKRRRKKRTVKATESQEEVEGQTADQLLSTT